MDRNARRFSWLAVLALASGPFLVASPAHALKPSCDDLQITDQQLADAYAAAEARFARSGKVIDSFENRYFLRLWKQIGRELGCKMPIARRSRPPASQPSASELGGTPSVTGIAEGCSSLSEFEPWVQYCGRGDSRTNTMPFVADYTVNHACWAHDSCYCSQCVRQECYFSPASEVTECDASLLRACGAAGAELPVFFGSRAICFIAQVLVSRGALTKAVCELGPTTCTGACDASVCYRGVCRAVTDQAGNSLLSPFDITSVRVMADRASCGDYACGTVTGCIADHQAEVGFFNCRGQVVPQGFCFGEENLGFEKQCGHVCGEFACGGAYRDAAWAKVRECINTRRYPQVPGEPELGTVVYFGSRRQIGSCLGCVPPITGYPAPAAEG